LAVLTMLGFLFNFLAPDLFATVLQARSIVRADFVRTEGFNLNSNYLALTVIITTNFYLYFYAKNIHLIIISNFILFLIVMATGSRTGLLIFVMGCVFLVSTLDVKAKRILPIFIVFSSVVALLAF